MELFLEKGVGAGQMTIIIVNVYNTFSDRLMLLLIQR